VKTGIAIFLTILLFNSLFYCCYFSVSVIHAKIEAHQTISHIDNNESAGIIKVLVNDLDKDESDEAWYKNKLYDVVKRKNVGGISYIYLLQDKDEEELIEDNYNYFNDNMEIFYTNSFKIPHSQKIVPVPDCQYIIPGAQKIIHFHFILKTPAVKNEYYFTCFNTEVSTPPPKLL
jgi:hypothetical protein